MPSEDPPYGRSPAELPQPAEVGAVSDAPIPLKFSGERLFGDEGDYDENMLVDRAQSIFSQATNYKESNILKDWERNLSHFNNKHAPGSKYRLPDYKRSRVFRPKTRSSVKQAEAGLATAMFSTTGLVNVRPQSSDPEAAAGAAMMRSLLQYRLEHRMPWELTVLGAYQDTKVYGICVSHQYWSLRQREIVRPAFDESGEPLLDEEGHQLGERAYDIEEDEPKVELYPPENLYFDPLCDWRDVAGTSPYLILAKPMRVVDALNMMKRNGGPWKDRTEAEIMSAGRQHGERIRQAREGFDRVDPAESQSVDKLQTVWAHYNIIRDDGEDWAFWTMGSSLLMTEPVKLLDEQPWLRRGERPVVVGISSVEAHRTYPHGDVFQIGPLQEAVNDVANQRSDNVKLVLNKRYYAKRGAQINISSLMKNVPGGVVLMNNPAEDVREVTTPDVTSSAYSEQEVLGSEMDQLMGGFDAQRAASDGASPGGIARAGAVASEVRDYGTWLFITTWVEPVLRQLMRLEQTYETDEVVLAIATDQSQVLTVFGEDLRTDDALRKELFLRVDASVGTLDPVRKVQRIREGVDAVAQLPEMQMRLKSMEIANEVFAALGFKDASRFFLSDEEYQEKVEAMPDTPTEIEVRMQELEIRNADNQMRNEREVMKIKGEFDARERDALIKMQSAQEDRIAKMEQMILQLRAGSEAAAQKDRTARDIEAAKVSTKTREIDQKRGERAQVAGG